MPKRFTDTDKWKKPFIKGLNAAYKLLWFYVCDDCDHAGIWQVDIEVAGLRIGEQINEQDAATFFAEKIVKIDGGKKWFIPSFIEFQYPSGLNPLNKAHAGIIKILNRHNLLDEFHKPLPSPLQGAKDKDMEMDKEMDRGGAGGDFLVPTMCQAWYIKFPHYTKNQVNDFPAMLKILQFITSQEGQTNINDPTVRETVLNKLDQVADQVLKDHFWLNKGIFSIANNIQEFYNKIKNPQDGKINQRNFKSTGNKSVITAERGFGRLQ